MMGLPMVALKHRWRKSFTSSKTLGLRRNSDKRLATALHRKALNPVLAVVQDADRLDAIGAIGITRTFTYGGSRNRAIYDPSRPPIKDITKAQYMNQRDSPSINHFYEKLLRLKDMMKSKAGKRRALARHDFMLTFLQQFFKEVEGSA